MPRRARTKAVREKGGVGNGFALDEHILSSIQDGISVLDRDLTVRKVNPTMERWYAHRMPLVGKRCYEAYHGRTRRCGVCPSVQTLRTGEAAREEAPLRGTGANRRGWLELFSFPLLDEAGQVSGVIEYVRDITARRRAEEALRESEERYHALFDQVAESIVLVDPQTLRIVEFNERAHRTLNYSRQEFAALRLTHLAPEGGADLLAGHVRAAAESGEQSFETRVRTLGGAVWHVRAGARAVTLRGRRFVLCVWHDVTDLKRRHDALENLSLTDELTGLHNRRGFTALAEQQLRIAKRQRFAAVLVFIDVDKLKRVNDALGHAAGDRALQGVAQVLRHTFRESDVVARLGGDEFAALTSLRRDGEGGRRILQRLAENLRRENRTRPPEARIAFSAGGALWRPARPVLLADLLAEADRAMYRVKRRKARAAARLKAARD